MYPWLDSTASAHITPRSASLRPDSSVPTALAGFTATAPPQLPAATTYPAGTVRRGMCRAHVAAWRRSSAGRWLRTRHIRVGLPKRRRYIPDIRCCRDRCRKTLSGRAGQTAASLEQTAASPGFPRNVRTRPGLSGIDCVKVTPGPKRIVPRRVTEDTTGSAWRRIYSECSPLDARGSRQDESGPADDSRTDPHERRDFGQDVDCDNHRPIWLLARSDAAYSAR